MSFTAKLKRWSLRLLIVLVALGVVAFVALRVASDPVPDGESGARADALAKKIESAVRLDAWNATAAVRWGFGGRHEHLWDRTRNLHEVTWGDHAVVIDLGTHKGCARTKGSEVSGAERDALLEKAYAMWVNDSFWLNPLGKLFDAGVVRKLVKDPEHGDALLITFTQNGLTPGDSYLWLLDSRGRPVAWRMWTKIPIGGLKASWEDWKTLNGGAEVATRHHMAGFNLRMSDVRGASSLKELLGRRPDPFEACNVFR